MGRRVVPAIAPRLQLRFPPVTSRELVDAATTALNRCDEIIGELHDLCCEPSRSPRMLALEENVRSIRADLDSLGTQVIGAEQIIDELESAGAEVGRLQIACCAPARMPLYAELLSGLSRTQRMVSATQGGMQH